MLDIETENDIIELSYNVYGQRTRKDINQTKSIAYYYEGDTLIKEDSGTDVLVYLYDEKNLLYGLIWNGVKYFYQKDVLGNISAILDSTGNSVVQYRYDPFGKILSVNGSLSSTLGTINPFRYKGYYYDVETQLFYCNSRYYSPELCRWISPDLIEYLDSKSINGMNLHVYCGNDPINKYDPTGHFAISLLITDVTINVTTSGIEVYNIVKKKNPNGNNTVYSNTKTIYTLFNDPVQIFLFGNITHSITTQDGETPMFYNFYNEGDSNSFGVGFNLYNWYGLSIHLTDNIGFGTRMQLTPWLTYGADISLYEGISFTIGFIDNQVTHEYTFSIGWGTLVFLRLYSSKYIISELLKRI